MDVKKGEITSRSSYTPPNKKNKSIFLKAYDINYGQKDACTNVFSPFSISSERNPDDFIFRPCA